MRRAHHMNQVFALEVSAFSHVARAHLHIWGIVIFEKVLGKFSKLWSTWLQDFLAFGRIETQIFVREVSYSVTLLISDVTLSKSNFDMASNLNGVFGVKICSNFSQFSKLVFMLFLCLLFRLMADSQIELLHLLIQIKLRHQVSMVCLHHKQRNPRWLHFDIEFGPMLERYQAVNDWIILTLALLHGLADNGFRNMGSKLAILESPFRVVIDEQILSHHRIFPIHVGFLLIKIWKVLHLLIILIHVLIGGLGLQRSLWNLGLGFLVHALRHVKELVLVSQTWWGRWVHVCLYFQILNLI